MIGMDNHFVMQKLKNDDLVLITLKERAIDATPYSQSIHY
jgi:hypothetical protein